MMCVQQWRFRVGSTCRFAATLGKAESFLRAAPHKHRLGIYLSELSFSLAEVISI